MTRHGFLTKMIQTSQITQLPTRTDPPATTLKKLPKLFQSFTPQQGTNISRSMENAENINSHCGWLIKHKHLVES